MVGNDIIMQRKGAANMSEFLKKFNRIQKISLVMLAVVLLCRLGGATGAWFTSEHTVINHFTGHEYYVDIELAEPNWISTGQLQASAMQPGMDIFKDPRVINISQDECIVRMRVEIYDKDGKLNDDSDKYKAVYGSIATYYGSGEPVAGMSRDFKELDGWFYYTGGGEYCKQLKMNERTSPLFTDVLIPNKKTDYGVYFKEGFKINVIAEAVFSVSDEYTVADAARKFGGEVLKEDNDINGVSMLYDNVASESGVNVKKEKYTAKAESTADFTSENTMEEVG